MVTLFWKNIIEELAYNSRAIAYGIWSDDGEIIHLNETMQDLKALSNSDSVHFTYPDFNSIRKLKKDDFCIYTGYITFGINPDRNSTLFSKIFYREKTYLVFSYLDIIETLEDTDTLGKLNQEVNNLQRKLTKENILLEKTLEEVNSLQAELEERTLELEKNNEELIIANNEKNKYIGIVAHDLRNPIGVISSFVDLLIRDINLLDKEEYLKFLENISDKSNFALNLIENYLDASKIESGILNLKIENNDFLEIVQRSILNNEFLANSKKQTIKLDSTEEVLMVDFDNDKMEQVFNNLISNAIKYSNNNSEIKIEIFKHDNNSLIVKVIDKGVGIPKKELSTVFDAYKTCSSEPTGGEKSTGLGLTSVKKIIEAHSGEISVESKLGSGSVFTITLPIKNPQ